ncbi:MAG TPA: ion channel [Daejeonella sp.]|nr:ion channel [Daejeonella sp.]
MTKKKGLPDNDLGFGIIPTVNNQRMLYKDGRSNIKRTGLPFFRTTDTYNTLITMSWTRFLLVILVVYLLVNVFFAYLYVFIGIEHLKGADGRTPLYQFFDAFFFSAQTISTVGYGHISPEGLSAGFLAAFESMLGLLAFALATGLLYGRFSRPSAKITYSENMVIAPYQNGKGLMFRLANFRRNQLIEIQAEVILSMNMNENGKIIRRFWPLDLERNKISLLTLSWTIVHPIDEKSPLFGLNSKDMEEGGAEFLVLLKAFDDTFSQTVHSRTSYQHKELIWDAKFKRVITTDLEGILTLDIAGISDYERLDL